MTCIQINVGGTLFQTTLNTLRKIPNTKLGRLKQTDQDPNKPFFFDRNPDVFNSILDLYRTGELHFPSNLCGGTIRKELAFWEIDKGYIENCCLEVYYKYDNDLKILNEIRECEKSNEIHFASGNSKSDQLKNQVWRFLHAPRSSVAATVFNIFFLLIVLLSTISMFLGTHQDFRINDDTFHSNSSYENVLKHIYRRTRPRLELHIIDLFCNIFFTLECFLQIVVAPRRKSLCTFLHVVDVIAILAFWVNFILFQTENSLSDKSYSHVIMILALLRMLRLFRFYRMIKQFNSYNAIYLALCSSLKQIGILVAFFALAVMFFAYIIYYLEFDEPHTFPNAFTGIWWSIVTMTTLGYGDVVPSCVLGRIAGSVCALSGILILAMPIAIVTTNFTKYMAKSQEYYKHREKPEVTSRKSKFSTWVKKITPIYVLNAKQGATNKDTTT